MSGDFDYERDCLSADGECVGDAPCMGGRCMLERSLAVEVALREAQAEVRRLRENLANYDEAATND